MPMPTMTSVGGDAFAVGEPDARRLAVLAEDFGDRRAEPDIDAPCAMLGRVEIGDRRPGDAVQQPVERLDHRDLLAQRAQHRRRFEADIAAADDRDPFHARKRRRGCGRHRRGGG